MHGTEVRASFEREAREIPPPECCHTPTKYEAAQRIAIRITRYRLVCFALTDNFVSFDGHRSFAMTRRGRKKD